MICVMTSKWVGDALGKDGIYAVWIAMRNYPWLSQSDYHDQGEAGASLMRSFNQLVVIQDGACTIADISTPTTFLLWAPAECFPQDICCNSTHTTVSLSSVDRLLSAT